MTIPKIHVDETETAIRNHPTPGHADNTRSRWESKVARVVLALIAVLCVLGLFGGREAAPTALICLTVAVGFLAVLDRLD